MYSKKQINWVIKYNGHNKNPQGQGRVFNVNPTTRKVRWLQARFMDVDNFEKAGLNIWGPELRKAVTNAVQNA